jgi:hypothetical protein
MLLNGQFHLSDTFFQTFSNHFVFVPSVYGEKFPTAEFWMISAEIPGLEIERK